VSATPEFGAKYMPPEGYNARWDASFPDIVIDYLRLHRGEWCQLGRIFSADCEAVRDVVEAARNLGDVIVGDPKRGYKYVGFQRRRWVHAAKVASWPPSRTETIPRRPVCLHIDGQLDTSEV
jgi:hypothetical protein